MNTDLIIDQLPYKSPFLFVDTLERIDDMGVEGCFTFREELDFYKGHFKGNPITPGVILVGQFRNLSFEWVASNSKPENWS